MKRCTRRPFQKIKKSLYQQKIIKKWQHKNANETSITQRLRVDLGRSVEVTIAIQLMWLEEFKIDVYIDCIESALNEPWSTN